MKKILKKFKTQKSQQKNILSVKFPYTHRRSILHRRPSDVHPSPRKLVFLGHFQPAFACPVVFLAEISFFQGSLVRQMLLLAKEMTEKVKNEIVLHPTNSDARCYLKVT